jgi:hypothetical protein
MEGDGKPALVALRRRREEVIEQLTDQFACDAIGLDEFELRLDRAHQATDLATLDAVVTDLEPASAASQERALARVDGPDRATIEAMEQARPRKKTMVAVLGGVERKGAWRVPKKGRVIAVMGGADLDFREAILPPGVTELRIVAIMGGADIVVPPDLAVECDGWAVLGGWDDKSRAPAVPDLSKPLLRITGYCLLGGFDIETRLPGESARDARKRRRRERKALKKQRERKQLPESTD